MSRRLFYAALPLLLLWPSAPARAQGGRGAEQPLTNASVIKLVRGGFSDKAVIAIINTRPARFDLAAERLIELKKNRVSERVILAMIGRANGELALAEGDWEMEDDSFFNDGPRPRADMGAGRPSAGAPAPGETNIFGSSGGSRGRVRSNGRGGSATDDTETLGAATARIIRPPAEAGGGGAPRLERTPTLTNESVVQLVEAGFTEGTIIRRIEQSPVEFDLSDKSLVDLRRRRVTERIIAAMRSAMADEGAQTAGP